MHGYPITRGLGHVLIVEDSNDSGWLLSRACQMAGHSVDQVSLGRSALDKLEAEHFDVMLLDLHLPDIDGVDILENVRSRYPDLITIVITGDPSQASAIAAVKAGAADYLCKPVSTGEVLTVIASNLAERAQQNLRLLQLSMMAKEQIGGDPDEPTFHHQEAIDGGDSTAAGLRFHRARQEVEIIGEREEIVPLTRSEAAVMAVFIDNAGKVLSPQDLVYRAWRDELEPPHAANIIRPLIFRLRQKLEDDPALPKIIRTVRGAGYVYETN